MIYCSVIRTPVRSLNGIAQCHYEVHTHNAAMKYTHNAGTYRFLESHWFVWATQISHLPKDVDFDKRRDWVSLQVSTRHCLHEIMFFPHIVLVLLWINITAQWNT